MNEQLHLNYDPCKHLAFAEKPVRGLFRDLTGERFERLSILGFCGRIGGQSHWWCLCSCGNVSRVTTSLWGRTRSCGCIGRERTTEELRRSATVHGESYSPEYGVWSSMRYRCSRPSHREYPLYGGRGIKVCDRWLKSVQNFIADMGRRPSPQHSIDRIDVNGDYELGNCRWATLTEQNNNKRITVFVEYEGKKISLADLCRRFNKHYPLVKRRYRKAGWSLEKSLFTPSRRPVGGAK